MACGRKLSICEGLHAERCVGGGGTSGLVTRTRPDQARVCRTVSRVWSEIKKQWKFSEQSEGRWSQEIRFAP